MRRLAHQKSEFLCRAILRTIMLPGTDGKGGLAVNGGML